MAPLRRKVVPRGPRDVTLEVEGRALRLSNLDKPFWPERGLTKGDLWAPLLQPERRVDLSPARWSEPLAR